MTNHTVPKKLDTILGLQVKVLNILDLETVGTVYSYIVTPGTLVIQVPSQTAVGTSYNYKVLRTSNIKSLEIISKNIDKTKIAQIAQVDSNQIPKVITRNTEAVELRKKTINGKVTREGQLIFNAVYKTMPNVRWNGVSIIILDEVQIDSPYKIDSIRSILPGETGDDEESDAIKLVKKIVDGVWLRFENERKGG